MQREKQYSAKSIQILPGNPTATAIHQILTWALENLDKQVEVIWPSQMKGSEYKLTAHADPMGGDPRWSLSVSISGQVTTIWEFASCDSLLVFNRIEASINEREGSQAQSAQQAEQEEAAEEKAFFYIPETLNRQRSTIPITPVNQESSLAKPATVLNGDLAFVQINALLQSIALAKMTGRLEVESEKGTGEVFFIDGQPIHATSPGYKGPECIYDLVTWKEGRFFFQPKVLTQEKSIAEPLDSLIIQGAQLLDKQNFLKNSGFKLDALMVKTQVITEDDALKKILAPAIPVNFAKQKLFYETIDGTTSSQQIIDKLGYPRSVWIPIVCNMITCGLAAFTKPISKRGNTVPLLEPKSVDSAAIQSVIMTLRRGDTGMFNYPAFLYFLEQEYFRGHRSGSPVSVIIFEMRVKAGPQGSIREPLPIGALREAVLRISQAKRHNDLLAHYEAFDYALLCPETKGEGARVFAKRLVTALTKTPLSTGVDASTLSLSFGAACVPEDFLELGLLLSAAEAAKGQALANEEQVVLYRDLLPPTLA